MSENSLSIILIIFLSACILLLAVFIVKKFRRGYGSREIDELDGLDFEYFCADLLEKNGFLEVQVTKASGDFGIDILAEKDGVTYGIQCKRYNDSVGIKAVQEAYAGKEYYDKMVGAVMTNQYFTSSAVKAANKLKILLWDRGYINSMLED